MMLPPKTRFIETVEFTAPGRYSGGMREGRLRGLDVRLDREEGRVLVETISGNGCRGSVALEIPLQDVRRVMDGLAAALRAMEALQDGRGWKDPEELF